jgi:hypothetical protein
MGVLDAKLLLKLAEFVISERANVRFLYSPKFPFRTARDSNPHGILVIILQHPACSPNIAERDRAISFVNFWCLTRACWRFGLSCQPRYTVRTFNSSHPASVGAPYGPERIYVYYKLKHPRFWAIVWI